MQDIDPSVRKAVYSKKLAVQRQRARGEDGEDIDGTNPVHPLQLTVSQRELVVQSGLADRDSSVSGAAAALIKSWVESLAEVPGLKAEDGSGSNYQDLLLSFLTLFDLQKGSIAQDALKSVLKSMDSTVGDGISFDGMSSASPAASLPLHTHIRQQKLIGLRSRLKRLSLLVFLSSAVRRRRMKHGLKLRCLS